MTESEADYVLETACHIDDLSDLNSPIVLKAQKNPDNNCFKVIFRVKVKWLSGVWNGSWEPFQREKAF